MKRLLIALICATLPAIAQIPSPQINLTGNIGCVGFPCLNSGTLIMSADADRTMTALETSAFYLKVTSSVPLTATRNLIAPLGNFPFTIENATTGGQAIQIIGTTGTGVTIPNGQTVAVWNDGTNFVQIGSAGGGIPGGSNTDVQYNNSGAFGGYPLTNFILSTGNQTITYNNNGASTLTIANPNAGSSAASGYLASNGTDFFALELAGTGTGIPGATSFVSSSATAPMSFQTGGGPLLFNAANANFSGALNYAADTGTANAYVVSPPSCVSAAHDGITINFKAANASTGASTLAYCPGSTLPLVKNGSTALTTGDILAGAQYSARYNAAVPNWQLLNSSLTGSSLPTAPGAGSAPVSTASGTGSYAATQIMPFDATYTFFTAATSACTTPATTGTYTCARNEATGAIQFENTDAAVVINDALGQIYTVGGTLYFKNGTYNFNSVTQETVSPYTNFYCVGIPSTNAAVYPQFNFVGESSVTSYNALSGVIFNVTSTALTAAGAGNRVDAFWMRPSTVKTVLGTDYWNGSMFFRNVNVTFPDNTRGYEHAIDGLESEYMSLINVGAAFVAAPTNVGATDTIAFVTDATPSDGAYIRNTIPEGGWGVGFQLNTEHTVVVNTLNYQNTTAYEYGFALNRNASNIGHGSQLIHAQVYDAQNGIVVGPYVDQNAQLDIIGLDLEYATTGTWAYVSGFTTGTSGSKNLVGGLLSWSQFHTETGLPGTLTTIFPTGGYGANYTNEWNGNAAISGVGTGTSAPLYAPLQVTQTYSGTATGPASIATTSAAANGNAWLFYGTGSGVDSYTVASGGTNDSQAHVFTNYDNTAGISNWWSYSPDSTHDSMQIPSVGCWGWGSSALYAAGAAPTTCIWQPSSDTISLGNGTPNNAGATLNDGTENISSPSTASGILPLTVYAPSLPNAGDIFSPFGVANATTNAIIPRFHYVSTGSTSNYYGWYFPGNYPSLNIQMSPNVSTVFGATTPGTSGPANGIAVGTTGQATIDGSGNGTFTKVNVASARKGTFVCTNGGTITIANTNELVTSDVIISMNTAGGTITTPPAMKTVTSGQDSPCCAGQQIQALTTMTF